MNIIVEQGMRVGGYGRLSRDEDAKEYASILAQKDIIVRFCKEHKLQFIDFYEDDNVSGYKFNERKGLTRLLDDLSNDKIDIIIAKDLSRIGRHNGRVLMLIEDIKQTGKSIITIDDNYNSANDSEDFVGIRSWFNERYIKDLSKKIRSNLTNYMQNNTYTNCLPYGYIKDEEGFIVVDEEAREIVKNIFDLYVSGDGILKIAKKLNEQGIPSPLSKVRSTAKSKGTLSKSTRQPMGLWSDKTILGILKNDMYIGTKRNRKTTRKGIHGKIEYLDESKHIVFENNHEPIIDRATFKLVQELIEKRKVNNYRGETKYVNPYSGFLVCKDCGKLMIARNCKDRPKAYACNTYKQFGKDVCSMHYIKEEDINMAIKKRLFQLKSVLDDFVIKKTKTLTDRIETDKNYDSIIKRTNNEIDKLRQEYKLILNQKIKALSKATNESQEQVIEEQYGEIERENVQKISLLEEQLKEFKILKERASKVEEDVKLADQLLQEIFDSEQIPKKTLEFFVEKIVVNQQSIPRIYLKQELETLVNQGLHNTNGVDQLSSHREMVSEQVHISIFILAASYLAKIYDKLKTA